ncbi:ATP-grasp fold amidoligase family protein [Pantoea sp. BAV 3049]|uniref:ATP-grasp fold amidoligase family protein n=1 Tax=Pantoea sp. BAV 3049 TaxID=2654188 RepID=UPI00131EA3F4|nr:ATP-grasp fold amidoligase family protein [Pantoea sp. BAV 3049]
MLKLKAQLRNSVLYLLRKMPWSYQDRFHYYRKFKKLPNIRQPKLFNEKILYRKFVTGDYVRYGILSDKVLVRDYIAKTIGDEYLIPLLHETDKPVTLLGLKSLKDTVIKSNHGSGMVEILLEEPDCIQKQLLIKRCEEWLTRDFSLEAREIHYRYIKPRILVEQYVGDGKFAAVDYKFHMFNKKDGNFEYVLQIIYNRCGNSPLSMNFYVNSLTSCFYKIRDTGLDISNDLPTLYKALELSKKLANDFDYVRVDWYINDGQIYFGELTFTPGAGLVTGLDHGLNEIMGNMWVQDHKSEVLPRPAGEVAALPVVLKKI